MKIRTHLKYIFGALGIFLLGNILHTETLSANETKVNEPTSWVQELPKNQEYSWIKLRREVTAFTVEIPSDAHIFLQKKGEEWKEILSDEDANHLGKEVLPETPDFEPSEGNVSPMELGTPFQEFRFRIESKYSEKLPEKIRFTFVDTRIAQSFQKVASVGVNIDGVSIISREAWGADESLRFLPDDESLFGEDTTNRQEEDEVLGKKTLLGCNNLNALYPDEFEINRTVTKENGKRLKWPFQYSSKIEKVVIHHTARALDGDARDPKEIMRAIYSYHALSRGWGDIGYNFVIDRNGYIYEGRAGGNNVVAGHVYCANVQTIGIALMGNFEEENPTDAQVDALKKFLPHLAKTYQLDLTAESRFHGKYLPNLLGHRDLGATACPGENMYFLLQFLRAAIGGTESIQELKKLVRSAEFVGKINILSLDPGEWENISLTFKNTGNVTWNSGTWLYVLQPKLGVSAEPRLPPKTYVAAIMNELTVRPEETGTFQVQVQAGYEGGLYSLEFTPVVDDRKISDVAIVQPVQVARPEWGARFREAKTSPEKLHDGERFSASIAFRNTGNTKWKKEFVSLAMYVNGKTYIGELNENIVQKNEEGHFVFQAQPFEAARTYGVRLEFLLSGKKMKGIPMTLYKIHVEESNEKGRLLTPKLINSSVTNGEIATTEIKILNSGNTSWNTEDVFLVLTGEGKSKHIQMKENVVLPKETATFSLSFTPQKNKSYSKLNYQLQKNTRIISITKGKWIIKNITTGKNSSQPAENSAPVIIDVPKETPIPLPSSPSKNIRIRLGFEGNDARITSTDSYEIWGDDALIQTASGNSTAQIEKIGSAVRLGEKNYAVLRFIPTSENGVMTIPSWNRMPEWDTSGKYNDNTFRGTIEFRVYEDQFIMINELPLEKYLRGLAEETDKTAKEKQKTMAILARSYALFYMQPENRKFPGAPYDGDDSPATFQKYLGYGYELRIPEFVKSVEETAGKVVTYEGKLIKTPYFSQSDGRTRSAEEVWGWTNTPYLQSVPDPYSEGLELKGHGVGLSGKGAEGMAQAGKTYGEIIKYFYKGVEIGESQ
ncbi:SpoIID/LytB domain-containing protein [Candidatus Peregrinibacteria bacterium]|nr:SpoIID/LytB domain-containing protein [Candidatus Peregrinibacteria bacterium]